MSVSLLPDGRGILRGGFGKFAERTPLTVGAFTQYEVQTVSRFAADGAPLGAARHPHARHRRRAEDAREHRADRGVGPAIRPPLLLQGGVPASQRARTPTSSIRTAAAACWRSRRRANRSYWEFETTGRYLASEHRDLTVSYVRSHSTRDLNDFDQFFGNFRNPIIRANENSLSPTDVPNRIIVRGTLGLPGKWVLTPVYEWRTGFPWSAVDEFQDFVGRAEPQPAAADGLHARLHAGAALALQEVSLHRRNQDLQRLRHRRRTRRAGQHRRARLRHVLQPDSALDRLPDFHQ